MATHRSLAVLCLAISSRLYSGMFTPVFTRPKHRVLLQFITKNLSASWGFYTMALRLVMALAAV